MTTTLITGAGMIGCHTASILARRGERVVLVDRFPAHKAIESIVASALVRVIVQDVTDFAALHQLCQTHGVQRIVHTAALLSTAIRKDPLAGIGVNVMGTANVLEVARQMGIKRVVLASSTTVAYPSFGDFHGASFPEDFPLQSLRHRPASIYAATKVCGEHLGLLYRDLYGVGVVALRYAAVIGAWSGPGSSVPSQVLSALVVPASRGGVAQIDDPFLLWLGGEEFIDARDCAWANVAALDAASPTQGVYNIGAGALSSFDDVVAAVRLVYPKLQVNLGVVATGGFAGFAHERHAPCDIAMAAHELHWRPQYGLTESVIHYAPILARHHQD